MEKFTGVRVKTSGDTSMFYQASFCFHTCRIDLRDFINGFDPQISRDREVSKVTRYLTNLDLHPSDGKN